MQVWIRTPSLNSLCDRGIAPAAPVNYSSYAGMNASVPEAQQPMATFFSPPTETTQYEQSVLYAVPGSTVTCLHHRRDEQHIMFGEHRVIEAPPLSQVDWHWWPSLILRRHDFHGVLAVINPSQEASLYVPGRHHLASRRGARPACIPVVRTSPSWTVRFTSSKPFDQLLGEQSRQ